MALVTIYLRNGKEFDFETAAIKVLRTKDAPNEVHSLDYSMKDNGRSLLFIDPREIVAIVRDTRKDED